MVNTSRVLNNQEMLKKTVVLQVHPYAITVPHKEKGRYQTYVKKDGGKRKIIRTVTFDLMIDKLYDFYFGGGSQDSITMDKLFFEWLPYKEAITNSPNTIRRHEQHWDKYFSQWKNRSLSAYDDLELNKACNLLVRDNNLSSKEWQNLKTILSGMFNFAYRKHYILQDYMKDVKITVKFRQVNKKSGKVETYLSDEYDKLHRYLKDEYAKTGDLALLAVLFDFCIGCRVGELVALKWCDLIDIKYLHICREEIKKSVRYGDSWKNTYVVEEHTKTHSDRVIPLVPDAIRIIMMIRSKLDYKVSDDDFIFVRDGERITSRQINYVLEKACNKLNIPIKRSHKIRKTVASRLSIGDVPLDSIREFLGHSNLNTTLGYIYNPLSDKETYNLMAKAL